MKKIYLTLSLAGLSLSSLAEVDFRPVLGREADRANIYNPRKSNWVSTFGFDAQGLLSKRDFQALSKTYADKTELLVGPRVGIGREFHLFWGLYTKSTIEGYFVGTLFEPTKKVSGGDSKADNSYTKKKGNIYGAEAAQSLSFVTEFHIPNYFSENKIKMYFEPFIEAAIGVGKGYYRFDYVFNESTGSERYSNKMEETFLSQRVSAGMNFIGTNGYFLTLKASALNHQVTKGNNLIYAQPNGAGATRTETDLKDETIKFDYNVFIGGGYKW